MIVLPRQRSRADPLRVVERRQLMLALDTPPGAKGLVLLVQARGNTRGGLLSQGIVPVFRSTGLATCVVDLVESGEARGFDDVCDVDFLTGRLAGVMEYLALNQGLRRLPTAILGRESAAAAAIRAAADERGRVRAVVCCAGRPGRAGIDTEKYQVPTLLLVPGADQALVRANEEFFLQLHCESQLAVIRDGCRIGESSNLPACQKVIYSWCVRYLGAPGESPRKMKRRRERAAFKGALVRG